MYSAGGISFGAVASKTSTSANAKLGGSEFSFGGSAGSAPAPAARGAGFSFGASKAADKKDDSKPAAVGGTFSFGGDPASLENYMKTLTQHHNDADETLIAIVLEQDLELKRLRKASEELRHQHADALHRLSQLSQGHVVEGLSAPGFSPSPPSRACATRTSSAT
jgi:hypothetical protein